MAKCKCKNRARIVSDAVRSINNSDRCRDVCANPICGDPNVLGAFAPVIYDSIGINLCTTFDLEENIAEEFKKNKIEMPSKALDEDLEQKIKKLEASKPSLLNTEDDPNADNKTNS